MVTKKAAAKAAPAKNTRPAAKAAAKAAPSKAAAPAAPKAAPAQPVAARAVKAAKADKAEKPRKPKLVRDSFTIPKAEFAVLEALKMRAAQLGRPAKKSEVLRAGVQALAAMDDIALLATLGRVETVKTGRPAKA